MKAGEGETVFRGRRPRSASTCIMLMSEGTMNTSPAALSTDPAALSTSTVAFGRDPPHASPVDRRLFDRVRCEVGASDALTSERLAELGKRFGDDFATAWL